MRDVDEKAVRLVLNNKVDVHHATFDTDGRLIEAVGTVTSTHTYLVQIDPEHTQCSCEYGQAHQDAAGHSHDQALRLAAQQENNDE